MKIIIFDTETTGLPANKKVSPQESDAWPYIVQFSWFIYDDVAKQIMGINNHIIKLPEGVTIPIEATKIHGITNIQMQSEGKPMDVILKRFTQNVMNCQILVAHNIQFDSKVIQAEYYRNNQVNALDPHRKIEYCTMKYGKSITNILKPSKFHNGMYLKPPRLEELYIKLFKTKPDSLHNSLMDVLVCFRCFHKMLYDTDIFEGDRSENVKAQKIFRMIRAWCGSDSTKNLGLSAI